MWPNKDSGKKKFLLIYKFSTKNMSLENSKENIDILSDETNSKGVGLEKRKISRKNKTIETRDKNRKRGSPNAEKQQ